MGHFVEENQGFLVHLEKYPRYRFPHKSDYYYDKRHLRNKRSQEVLGYSDSLEEIKFSKKKIKCKLVLILSDRRHFQMLMSTSKTTRYHFGLIVGLKIEANLCNESDVCSQSHDELELKLVPGRRSLP